MVYNTPLLPVKSMQHNIYDIIINIYYSTIT